MSQSKIKQRVGFYVEVSPEELGELPWGHPDHDPDLHCTKYRFISPKMQEEQEIAEKKLRNEFVDEDVQEAQQRVSVAIPKTNLCIPVKWFHYDSDAEDFIKAVAKANNIAVHCFGRTTAGRSLCIFLDVVSEYRHLRIKNEDDPPSMSLQDRRIRHWKAVVKESSIARGFSLRLVRYVTLMLVGASADFARQNGKQNESSDLGGRIEKLRDWFEEVDPEDLKAFEFLQPKRMPPQAPKYNVACPQPRDNEKRKGKPNSRKRKAETIHSLETLRSKRQRQMHLPAPPQRAPPPPPRTDRGYKPPRRIAEGKRGKKNWIQRY